MTKQNLLGGLLAATLLLASCQDSAGFPQSPPVPSSQPEESKVPVSSSVSEETAQPETDSSLFAQWAPRAREIMEGMPPERKVAQMLLSATFLDDGDPVAQAKTDQPGGYVFFRKDFEGLDAQTIREKVDAMQAVSEIPMLFAVDEEGGTVVRISSNPLLRETPFQSAAEVYAQGLDFVRSDALEKGELLRSLGCNVLLAPVADMTENPEDYIYRRTTGKGPEETSAYVKAVVEGAAEAGCGTTLKHFPGYGNNINTHTGIAVDERPYENFLEKDFLPFQAGIEAGCPSVLVSHNIVNCMDPDLPASISPEVHRILREELGFTGVIMTDDLTMDAILLYTGEEDPAVLAVQAGNDLLLTQNFPKTYEAIWNALQDGRISQETIDEAVVRVLSWKLSLGLMT